MFAHGLIITFALIGALWIVWKYIISPMIPDSPEQEHRMILEKKLEKLRELRDEYESVKTEKEVTAEIERLDSDIDKLVKDIKDIEK